MTGMLALACGEVPWERDILEAVSRSGDLEVARRYVDMGALTQDARAGLLAPVVLLSPAVRGFEPKSVSLIVAATTLTVVVLDSIRPPWLASSVLDCRDLRSLHLPSFVEELSRFAQIHDAPAPSQRARLTVFAGVAGGVGVTTLAWVHATRGPDTLLVEADVDAPSLEFLCATSTPLSEQLSSPQSVTGVLTMSLHNPLEVGEREAVMVLESVSTNTAEVVVDAGRAPLTPFASAFAERADRLIVVTTPAPSDMVRLPRALNALRGEAPETVVVVNRMRDSAVASSHGRSALRGLVERATGITPQFIDDMTSAVDTAWLRGDCRALLREVPPC